MKRKLSAGVSLVFGFLVLILGCSRSPVEPNREAEIPAYPISSLVDSNPVISKDSTMMIRIADTFSPCPETTFHSVFPRTYLPEPRLGKKKSQVEVVIMGNLWLLQNWWQETLLPIKEKYGRDVSFIFTNRRPDIFMPDLYLALENVERASEAAGMLNHFWAYARVISVKTEEPTLANLIAWSWEAGMNPTNFKKHMNLLLVKDEVASDLSFSKAISQNSCCFGNICYATVSTSTFFVGNPEVGYQRLFFEPNFEKLSAVIDSLLIP